MGRSLNWADRDFRKLLKFHLIGPLSPPQAGNFHLIGPVLARRRRIFCFVLRVDYDEFMLIFCHWAKQLRILTTRWVGEAYEEVCRDSEFMKGTFESTGLSLRLDGSEDDKIHFVG